MRKTTAQYNTSRPLTEEEREFASRKENHNLIYTFCIMHGLDKEEFYDVFAVPYVQCVKKYFEVEKLHSLAFGTVLFKDLGRTLCNYYRDLNRDKRRPSEGFISYDLILGNSENEEFGDILNVEGTETVESVSVDKLQLLEVLKSLNEMQKTIVEMLMNGYEQREICEKVGCTQRTYYKQKDIIKSIVAEMYGL